MNPNFRSSPLVPLVKKMSEDLRALEIEYNYLSTQINPENESKYPSIEILCRKGSYQFKVLRLVDTLGGILIG